jgi:dsRNA-specific ribonuclease
VVISLQAAAAVGSQPTKTPVSVLQELCVKRQITPKYDLIQIEGSVHEPTFKYRVTVGEYVGELTVFIHSVRACDNAYARPMM